jgi:hypothetical protein
LLDRDKMEASTLEYEGDLKEITWFRRAE